MPLLDPVSQRRIEAVAIMAACIAAYAHLGFSFGFFLACFFVPDLSILFYVVSPRVGAIAYNGVHFFLGPILVGSVGVLDGSLLAQQIALIWAAHVAFDRAIGWGLKYEQSFCHTDMGTKTLILGPRWLVHEEGS